MVTLSNPETTVKPRKRPMRNVGLWTALGVLGADGWELVSVQERSYFLKRLTSE